MREGPNVHRRKDDPRGLVAVVHQRVDRRRDTLGLRGRQMHRRDNDERGIYSYHERKE